MSDSEEPNLAPWRELLQISGIGLITGGACDILLLGAFGMAAGLPTSGADLLAKVAAQTRLVQGVMGLFIVADISVLASLPAIVVVLSSRRAWPLVAAIVAAVALIVDIVSSLFTLACPGSKDRWSLPRSQCE
jgi:hypothetical protein